jgi:hypothetical protein
MRLFLLTFVILLNLNWIIAEEYSLGRAIEGTKAPKAIVDSLTLLKVEFYDFQGKLNHGYLVVNIELEDDVRELFELIRSSKFPIDKVVPIVHYEWDDDASMQANNTSAFNYRTIAGTNRLSHHATGRAIDINPFQNPVMYSDGKSSPKGAKYNPKVPGTLTADSEIVKFMKSRGWRWGGDWTSFKDYHHFDKP